MPTRTALIVGAGIGGLATGIALRQAGWRVRVFERAENPRELGFALNLAPNAIAALRELGVADAIVHEGDLTGDAEIRAAGGRVLRRINISSALDRATSVVALRPVLHGALMNAVGADALVLARPVTAFDETGDRVRVIAADGTTEEGDVLVGADGVGSVVRKQIHPDEPRPTLSRYTAARGVAYGANALMSGLSAVAYFGDGFEAATVQAGRDAIYWYMSLLTADVRLDQDQPRAMLETRARTLDDHFRAILAATPDGDFRIEPLYERAPLERWGRGRVTLVGDAAHPMLPHTGQGAAQSLEDAVALGLALKHASDVPAALRRYEAVRALRTRDFVRRGPRLAGATTTHSAFVAWIRSLIVRRMPMSILLKAFLASGGPDPHRELRAS